MEVRNYSGGGFCKENRPLIQDAWDEAPYANNMRLEKLCFKDLDGQVWVVWMGRWVAFTFSWCLALSHPFTPAPCFVPAAA